MIWTLTGDRYTPEVSMMEEINNKIVGPRDIDIDSPGLSTPNERCGWYRWEGANDHGYTTLLSCAGTYMSKEILSEVGSLLDLPLAPEGSQYIIGTTLVPEPDNEYDPDAIGVTLAVGPHKAGRIICTSMISHSMIGYIPGKAGGYLNREVMGMIRKYGMEDMHCAVVDVITMGEAPGGRTSHHNVVLRIWMNETHDIEEFQRNLIIETLMR